MRANIQVLLIALAFSVGGVSGCFYPPATQRPAAAPSGGASAASKGPAPSRQVRPVEHRIVLNVPYDLTWDAVHKVIKKNDYRIQAEDLDHGIVEAEGLSFTLKDADCGQIRSMVGKYNQEPAPGATAVFNFIVKPVGPAETAVSVSAAFTTPLQVPLRPPRDFQCTSRGKREALLLKQVAAVAAGERRPKNAPVNLWAPESREPLPGGRSTLLKPHLERPELTKPEL